MKSNTPFSFCSLCLNDFSIYYNIYYYKFNFLKLINLKIKNEMSLRPKRTYFKIYNLWIDILIKLDMWSKINISNIEL